MRVRVLLLLTVLTALALFAIACGRGGDESTSTATPSVSAEDGGELTAEQAIQRVLELLAEAPDQSADASTATARRMTECEALDMMGWEGVPRGRPLTPPSGSPVWLVEVRGEFSGFIGYGLTPDPSPQLTGKFLQIVQLDGSFGAAAGLPDERTQEGPELSREKIIERALLEIDIPENEAEGGTATAGRTTYRDALARVQQEGAPQNIIPGQQSDATVWLFGVRGHFVGPCSETPESGKYLLILALDGFVESSGFIPDATPIATASPAPSPEPTPSPEAVATLTPSPPPTIYDLIHAGDLVIYGGTLIDGTGADPLPNAVVVVSGERITVVAQEPVFHPPADTQAVNARGGTIMPGIIDSHVHITGDITGPDGLLYWLEEGVTTVRDVASIPRPAELKMLVAALGGRAPMVVVAGPIVTAPGGYAGIDYKSLVGQYVKDAEDARTKVGELLDEGADIIKISLEPVGLPVMSLETAQAITQLVHERGTVVTAHATPLEGVRLAIDAGVDSLAHSPLQVPPKEMVDEMIAKGMYVVSTLDIYGGQGANFLTPFAQAGGKVALGTDYGCCEPGYVPGGMPVKEMQLLLNAGLTPMQVIVAATKHGAEVSNLGDELGTIEPGKLADIIVVDGDPLVDIRAMENVTAVIKGGQVVVDTVVLP
jgi:imidazolonepropionase-like amidohydrolase